MATKRVCDRCGSILENNEKSGFQLQTFRSLNKYSAQKFYDQRDACLSGFEKFVATWVYPQAGAIPK